jgi:hypothetical protein
MYFSPIVEPTFFDLHDLHIVIAILEFICVCIW